MLNITSLLPKLLKALPFYSLYVPKGIIFTLNWPYSTQLSSIFYSSVSNILVLALSHFSLGERRKMALDWSGDDEKILLFHSRAIS